MEPNNTPESGEATKSAPSLSSNPSIAPSAAGMPGKPPKLYTRLRMASLTAPQVIDGPSKRNYAALFFGKQRMTAWGIAFLIAVVVALSGVIKLVQADAKNEENSKMTALEQMGKLKASMGTIEKEKVVLTTRVAGLEQKWKKSLQLQAELAKVHKLRAKAEADLQLAMVSKTANEQDLATLKARLKEVSQKAVIAQEQAKQAQALQDKEKHRQAELTGARYIDVEAGLQQTTIAKTKAEQDLSTLNPGLAEVLQKVLTIKALRDEISKEKQRQKSLLKDMANASEAIQAAKKKKTGLQLQGQVTEPPTVEQFDLDHGEPPSGAIESAQDTDNAKTPGVFLLASSEANRHFKAGFRKWDAGDVDGSIAEFKKTIRLDSSAAVAYYNIALGYVEKGDRHKACEYAYQAGEIYLKNKENNQANRVVEFMKIIDPGSSLIKKLRKPVTHAKRIPERDLGFRLR